MACLVVENVAVRRGMQDVDRILEAEYEARRVHRQVRIMAHLFILFLFLADILLAPSDTTLLESQKSSS